jgi:phage terminase large subunit-like protein
LSNSPAQLLASLPEATRLQALKSLTPEQQEELLHDWRFWARPEQLEPPGDWRIWLILTGRGWGKTRTGAEWVRAQVRSGAAGRIALVAPTAADARDVMVEGESGILSIGSEAERPHYEPSKRRLTWPNGAIATLYSAEEPERLRGPQHDAAWCDELAAWRYMDAAWDMLMFGLRLGDNPRAVVTTTPKPKALLKTLLKDPHTHATRGSTYDNLPNLAPQFADEIIQRYKGTRLGRQELAGELLEDVEGALWTRAIIDGARVEDAPDLSRIVVGVDPAVTSGEDSCETGIVVAGQCGEDFYVLADWSGRMTPEQWARRAVNAYHEFSADRVIGEVNNGGDLVESVIRNSDRNVAYSAVHASRGKAKRAEPIEALYEQGRVHHVGQFATLEDQMCSFVPQDADASNSPDRMDALVWALTDLSSTSEPDMWL